MQFLIQFLVMNLVVGSAYCCYFRVVFPRGQKFGKILTGM